MENLKKKQISDSVVINNISDVTTIRKTIFCFQSLKMKKIEKLLAVVMCLSGQTTGGGGISVFP